MLSLTIQGLFLSVLAKTQFQENCKTQFENAKTQFETPKTQFQNLQNQKKSAILHKSPKENSNS